jgi:hypothetical protein
MSADRQLALPTSVMTLEQLVADHCDPFDEVIRRLEIEAMEDAQLDDEAQVVSEFWPLANAASGPEPDDGWEWL